MSMISEQVTLLREIAIDTEGCCYPQEYLQKVIDEAADTIEALSAKLEANMETPSMSYGDGWIPCSERLPEIMKPVLVCDKKGNVCIRTITCVIKDKKYWSQNKYDVIAWQPLPKAYHG